MPASGLTARQQAWFATLRDGIARETGRTIVEWVEIARACPETRHRARLAWLKTEHGLGQNRASIILQQAFPPAAGWSEPDALAAALWRDPAARAIFTSVHETVTALEGVTVGQRKAFTGFSRTIQFAAARPKGSAVLLGLAIAPDTDPRLAPSGRAGWSERLLAVTTLAEVADVSGCETLLHQAWSRS